MTSSRKYAEIAAAALGKMLRDGTDSGKVAEIVESVLADATREREDEERQHLAEVEATAATRLARRGQGRLLADLRQRKPHAAIRLCRERISRRS